MVITGRHIHGMRGANRSIRKQKPIFSRLGLPETKALYHGTININTEPKKYRFLAFDYFFENVTYKRFPRKRTESFGFISILKLMHKGETYHNWGYIYLAKKSPHADKDHVFELLGREIQDFSTGDSFEITIKDGMMEVI